MQEITTDNVPVRFLVPVASPAVIVAWRRSFASYYVPMIVGDLATGDQMTVFAKAAYSKIPYQQNLGGEKSPGVAMVMGPVVCKESSDALLPMGVQAGLVLLLCIVSIIDGLDGRLLGPSARTRFFLTHRFASICIHFFRQCNNGGDFGLEHQKGQVSFRRSMCFGERTRLGRDFCVTVYLYIIPVYNLFQTLEHARADQ